MVVAHEGWPLIVAGTPKLLPLDAATVEQKSAAAAPFLDEVSADAALTLRMRVAYGSKIAMDIADDSCHKALVLPATDTWS